MQFELTYGNLVEKEADFIVNASNTELNLGSGVSKAFYEHCGGEGYQLELDNLKAKHLKEKGPIEQGEVIISDAGSAKNFTYALHAAVMNYSDASRPGAPTYETVAAALDRILEIVEEKIITEEVHSPIVVLPLLGCGVGGLEKERVFEMIRDRFQSAFLDMKVYICFHKKQEYERFLYL